MSKTLTLKTKYILRFTEKNLPSKVIYLQCGYLSQINVNENFHRQREVYVIIDVRDVMWVRKKKILLVKVSCYNIV